MSVRQRNAAAARPGTARQPASDGQSPARGTRTWLRAGLVLLAVLPVLAAVLLLLTARPGSTRKAREPAGPTVPDRR